MEFTGGIGVSSIIKTAEKYDGEYDFNNDNRVFGFRMIMTFRQFCDRKESRMKCSRIKEVNDEAL